jgi:hypothetical protein
VAITSLGHPSGAREVAFERSPRAVGVAVRVNMQDDPRDIAPVGTVRIGIEQAQVRDEMPLVVGGKPLDRLPQRRKKLQDKVGTVETQKRRVTSELPSPSRVKWPCISAALVLQQRS